MEITIEISKKELEHLKRCSSEYDACSTVTRIIEKVKRQLNLSKKSRAKSGVKK